MTMTVFSDPEHCLNDLLIRYPQLLPIRDSIHSAYQLITASIENGGKLLVCGNGGSAADSLHIVGELMKSFTKKRPVSPMIKKALQDQFGVNGTELGELLEGTIPAAALVENISLSTALQNDTSDSIIFAQQILGIGKKEDVLLCLSTSGNANNIIHAVMISRVIGMSSILLSGFSGGKLKNLCDISICVPEAETYKIQELHLPIYHCICQMLELYFF